MTRMTPTARSLQYLRKLGYLAYVVEKWNPHARIRQDFGGFADVLAFGVDAVGVLAVQCTSTDHAANRFAKVIAVPAVRTWLRAGNAVEIWGWSLKGKSGERKRYTLDRRPIVLADLKGDTAA